MTLKAIYSCIALSILSACATVQDSSYSYEGNSESAMLVSLHQQLSVTLIPIDLDTVTMGEEPLLIGGEFVKVLNYSKERLTDSHLNDLNYMKPSAMFLSGFEANQITPGHYAIVESFSASNLAGTYSSLQGCFMDDAYVVDVAPNTVNYLEPPWRLMLRQQYGDAADAMPHPSINFKMDIKPVNQLERLKFTLEEFPNVKGTVQAAPVIAKVKFARGKKSWLMSDGCDLGDSFEVLENL